MASSVLSDFLNKKVTVISTDGNFYIGHLEGYDHSTNIALRNTVRRDLSPSRSTLDENLGLFIIRGDCVSVIGEIDAQRESQIDWNTVTTSQQLKRFR